MPLLKQNIEINPRRI